MLKLKISLLFLFVFLTAQLGMATSSFSFTGNFTSDTDIQFFTFTLAADTANVTILTWSSGGTGLGTNAHGDSILPGGFDPLLSFFQADGSEMNPGISGSCPVPQNIYLGNCLDIYYPTTASFPGGLWSAGTYIVALTENGNGALGNLSLADPTQAFFEYGVMGLGPNTNYSCQVGPDGFQGTPPTFPLTDPFCSEFTGGQDDGHWAVDILNVDTAATGLQSGVPEPGTTALGLIGFAAIAALRRLRSNPRQ